MTITFDTAGRYGSSPTFAISVQLGRPSASVPEHTEVWIAGPRSAPVALVSSGPYVTMLRRARLRRPRPLRPELSAWWFLGTGLVLGASFATLLATATFDDDHMPVVWLTLVDLIASLVFLMAGVVRWVRHHRTKSTAS